MCLDCGGDETMVIGIRVEGCGGGCQRGDDRGQLGDCPRTSGAII